MQPIAGYNYGAGLYHRVNKVLKHTIVLGNNCYFYWFSYWRVNSQTSRTTVHKRRKLLDLTVQGMRIAFAAFPIIGFQMVSSNFFQSIGKPGKAIYVTLQTGDFPDSCCVDSSKFFGIAGVWMSLPVADTLAAVNSAFLLAIHFKK